MIGSGKRAMFDIDRGGIFSSLDADDDVSDIPLLFQLASSLSSAHIPIVAMDAWLDRLY